MHELSVCFEVVRTLEELVAENGLTEVQSVTLEIGELSSMIPKYMEECFPAAVDGTIFERTKLEIEVIPGLGRCNSCSHMYQLLPVNGVCPECGEKNFSVISGTAFNIKEILAC
ncbi:MAG: hydrogenase nickel incorporation protein HypA [Firmicutes bacterium HGW-Firmicutes-16]|nr:MAG: hydrogenase nickel incorporation protein HypA [Firmicutes bacterium HGW-Firmicutes-16]